jgi:hypothetical protein
MIQWTMTFMLNFLSLLSSLILIPSHPCRRHPIHLIMGGLSMEGLTSWLGPTFDIYPFDEYQVPMPGTSAEGGGVVRRKVTFMVLRRSHGPYVIGSSVMPAITPYVANRFLDDQAMYAQPKVLAGWMTWNMDIILIEHSPHHGRFSIDSKYPKLCPSQVLKMWADEKHECCLSYTTMLSAVLHHHRHIPSLSSSRIWICSCLQHVRSNCNDYACLAKTECQHYTRKGDTKQGTAAAQPRQHTPS